MDRKEKKLEIILEEFLRKEQFRLISQSEFKRLLGNFTKQTGISEADLRELFEPIIRKLVDQMLAR